MSVSMEDYYTREGIGLNVWADGKSMVHYTSLDDKSVLHLASFKSLEKIFLIWAGSIKGTNDFENITLQNSQKKNITIKADKVFRDKGNSNYSCFADITSYYTGEGNYIIKNLKADPVGNKGTYRVGGYAVVVVYENPKDDKRKRVLIKAGLLILRPGEIHSMNILKKGSRLIPQQVTVIGGQGLKGNAGANLLNGICFSGKEDWDGSSGTYWDIDTNTLQGEEFNVYEQGLTLSFDPLLQWIFPVAVIFIFDKGGE